MQRPLLAVGIPTFNRVRMLDAILRDLVPACEALSVPIFISDNGSKDDTERLCRSWAERCASLHYHRYPETIPGAENLMSALSMSDAEYTWLCGDDDYIFPDALRLVYQTLDERRPDALVVGAREVPHPDFAALDEALSVQLGSLLDGIEIEDRIVEYHGADSFFAAKLYQLPVSTVVYPTERTVTADYHKYLETHHPHIGALFDALAVEHTRRGGVNVLELTRPCSISLTVHDDYGKKDWADLVGFLAREGFSKWLSLLPSLYKPHMSEAEHFHRHIFRAVLAPESTEDTDEL